MARRPQPLTPQQKTLVANVRRVAKQRSRANEAYLQAVFTARDAGVTYQAIATAAGTSSQAAQEIVRRMRSKQAAGEHVSLHQQDLPQDVAALTVPPGPQEAAE